MSTGFENLAVLLNNFIPAGLLATVLLGFTTVQRAALRNVLQFSILFGVVIALAETVLHTTLLPFYLDGLPFRAKDGDFRPIALYDHPLTGATVTVIGAFIPPYDGALRAIYLVLMALGLVAFGSRSALAVATLCVFGLCVSGVWRVIVAGHVRHRTLSLTSTVPLLVLTSVVCLIACEAGLAERLVNHSGWDPSAEVRLQQWRILEFLDIQQITFGIPRQNLIALLETTRLAYGVPTIENFWLLLFVSLGLFGFPFFVGGLTALLAFCSKQGDSRASVMVLATLAVASTSTSLGHKSPLLIILVAAAFAMRRSSSVGRRPSRYTSKLAILDFLPGSAESRLAAPQGATTAAWSRDP